MNTRERNLFVLRAWYGTGFEKKLDVVKGDANSAFENTMCLIIHLVDTLSARIDLGFPAGNGGGFK